MGRFVYSMHVSIDGRVEQVPGDNGAGEWLRIDEELHQESNRWTREVAAIVHGRIFYEIMEDFWPHAGADASLPAVLREYGELWVTKPKVLVSRTRADAGYNTSVIAEDAVTRLAEFREATDGAIGVGGVSLATQLLRAGLLDELLLFTHPAYLGFGRQLFDGDDRPRTLDVLDRRLFASGVTMHHYAIRRDDEAR